MHDVRFVKIVCNPVRLVLVFVIVLALVVVMGSAASLGAAPHWPARLWKMPEAETMLLTGLGLLGLGFLARQLSRKDGSKPVS